MKKTLLIAAAALVAGIVSSEAQVYSVNIVGYVNHPNTANSADFIANPLTTGNDVLTNILTGVPGGSAIQYWTGTSFVVANYSSKSGHWTSVNGNEDNHLFPPGVGFFYTAASNSTNTFVGSVVVNSGSTATNALSAGVAVAAGEMIPFGDTVTNTSTVNLVLGGGSALQSWNPATQKYTIYNYSSKSGNWTPSNPTLAPAQGFFVTAAAAGNTNWVQKSP